MWISGTRISDRQQLIKTSLKNHLHEENIAKVCDHIDLIDNIVGLKEKVSTHYKREKFFKRRFNFVEPIRVEIGTIRNKVSFCMRLPVAETLYRMLSDDSLRKFIINEPIFSTLQSVRI